MRRLLITMAACALVAGCTRSPAADNPASRTVRIGEFNIEYGGTVVDWDQTVAAARALNADVLAIEEAWGNTRKLAAALGYPYVDPRRQLMSRMPILHAPGDPMELVYVELAPGEVVAIGNVHLTSGGYGPKHTPTASAASVIDMEERLRVPEIQPYADALAGAAAAGVPAFLVGDLNSPSHLDWTEATVGERPQMTYPLAWPVTETLAAAGFTDSYRAIHPDPVQDPGLTWPAARPEMPGEWNPGPRAPADRIDTIQVVGPATTTASEVLTEDAVDPWPSDHRALVSTFSVTPGMPPPLVSTDERAVEHGASASIRSYGDGTVSLTDDAGREVASQPTDGANAALMFDTSAWAPGRYDVSLADPSGESIATTELWIAGPDEGPSITVDRQIAQGQPIDIAWHLAPGNRWDWLGIYRRGADPEVADYLLWAYTDAAVAGRVSLDKDAEGSFPLPAGDYTAMLLVDDGYQAVASEDFTITPG